METCHVVTLPLLIILVASSNAIVQDSYARVAPISNLATDRMSLSLNLIHKFAVQ